MARSAMQQSKLRGNTPSCSAASLSTVKTHNSSMSWSNALSGPPLPIIPRSHPLSTALPQPADRAEEFERKATAHTAVLDSFYRNVTALKTGLVSSKDALRHAGYVGAVWEGFGFIHPKFSCIAIQFHRTTPLVGTTLRSLASPSCSRRRERPPAHRRALFFDLSRDLQLC